MVLLSHAEFNLNLRAFRTPALDSRPYPSSGLESLKQNYQKDQHRSKTQPKLEKKTNILLRELEMSNAVQQERAAEQMRGFEKDFRQNKP